MAQDKFKMTSLGLVGHGQSKTTQMKSGVSF